MGSKTWWTSKTLWANAIALVAMIVQGATGSIVIDESAQVGILAVLNMVLRMVTTKGLTA